MTMSPPDQAGALETFSKRAAIASLVVVTILQLVVHPDLTPLLRAAGMVALAIGWITARPQPRSHFMWLLAAPFAPAFLRLLTGREGPVLDLAWMAGLTGALIRTVSWSRWTLPPTWRVLAGGWALTISLAWPILAGREIGFDPNLLRDQGAVNSWGLLSAPSSAAWILYIAWTHLLGLLWLDWIGGRFADAPDDLPGVVHALWIGTTVAGVVAIYQGIVDPTFLSTPFWAAYSRATGTLLDANAYGMCAAIAGPIAFAILRARGSTLLGTSALTINLAGMWMSGSRNSLLCAIIGTAAVLVAMWQVLGTQARQRFVIALGGSMALLAIVLGAADAVGPARRLAELPDTPTAIIREVLERPPYGPTAMRMVRDYPAAGVGIGAYQIISPDYWRQMADQMLPFDTAQNWWRHQATELGLLGAMTLFLWSGVIAWTVLMARPRRPGVTTTIVRGVVIALGVSSIIHVPTQTPLVLLWFLFLLAWLVVGLCEPVPLGLPRRMISAVWIAVTALAVAYAGTHVMLARGRLNVAERAQRAQREYIVGTYPPERLNDGTAFRWTGQQARLRLPKRGRWLVLRLWAHHPDLAEHPVEVMLSTPCGPLDAKTVRTHVPVNVFLDIPEGNEWVDVSIAVSRTWRPADQGAADPRDLGVGIAADFVDSLSGMAGTDDATRLPVCPAAA
jgi:hypothetical protein